MCVLSDSFPYFLSQIKYEQFIAQSNVLGLYTCSYAKCTPPPPPYPINEIPQIQKCCVSLPYLGYWMSYLIRHLAFRYLLRPLKTLLGADYGIPYMSDRRRGNWLDIRTLPKINGYQNQVAQKGNFRSQQSRPKGVKVPAFRDSLRSLILQLFIQHQSTHNKFFIHQ